MPNKTDTSVIISANEQQGAGAKLKHKKWPIVIIIILLLAAISSCSSNGRNTSSDEPDSEAVTSSAETQTSMQSSFDLEEANATVDRFIDAFNANSSAQITDAGDIASVELNSTEERYFRRLERNPDSAYRVGHYGANGDVIGIRVYYEDSEERVQVCGLFDKNERMVSAFHTAFFLLSKNVTQEDFDELTDAETFLYGGKDGEIKGVVYDVGVHGGYHDIDIDVSKEDINF